MNTTTMDIPSNRVRDVRRYCCERLSTIYDDSEAQTVVYRLFEGLLGWNKVQLLLQLDDTINQSDLLRFYWAVQDLLRHRPIQYVVGYEWFCDCKIGVAEGVLIPRPETEELVRRVIRDYQDVNRQLRVLDLCTGSGCIAVALARHLRCEHVAAVDLSDVALQQAKKNADNNGVNVQFVKADVLISNPPYVRQSESKSMRHNVLDYEPAEALFVDDENPLLFYRAVARLADRFLASKGTLYLEINEALANEIRQVVEHYNFSTTLCQDFRGKDRFIIAKRS